MRDEIGSAEVTADHVLTAQDGNAVKDCLFIVGAGREQERVDISRSVGDELRPVRSHRDRFGSVLCSGETRDEAIDNARRALRCLNIVTTGGANV